MNCAAKGCTKEAETDSDICFRHRVLSVGVNWKGSALAGHSGWNRSRNDYMLEHFGTADDRELGKKGIERAAP